MTELALSLSQVEKAIQAAAPSDCPALLGELERLKALAQLRMMNGAPHVPTTAQVAEENYLTVQQVCDRFRVSAKWLYRHKKQMPHSQPSRKILLFPEKSITKWFASRKG